MLVRPFARALVLLSLPALGCEDERARAPQLDAAVEPVEREDAASDPDAVAEPVEQEDAASSEPRDAGCADACAPATDQLEDGIVGSACDDDAVCGNGRCLFTERITSTPFPGGYCTGRCRDDAECGARGYCAPGFRGALGSCFSRCESDEDCGREGYRCRVANDIGRCMPGPKPLPEGVIGNACESDDDCGGASMACKAEVSNLDAPGGYCSQSCSVDADCSTEGACVSGLGTAPLSIGTCFARCDPPNGCRDGYACNALSAVGDRRGGVCVPLRTAAGTNM